MNVNEKLPSGVKMATLELTRRNILIDIEVFKKRIRNAQIKLAALPRNAKSYKERKKLQLKRSALRQEIKQVNGMIMIAEEAVNNE